MCLALQESDSVFDAHAAQTLNGHTGPVLSVCFDHTGEKLASGGGHVDNSVRLCSTESCAPPGSPLTFDSTVDSPVCSVAFSPDGSKIAAAHANKIQIFDAQTQAKLGSPLSGHSGYVTAVSYLFSNVWCVLTIEHFTGKSLVFPSVQMGNKLQVAAGTKASEFGRRRRARACRR